MGPIKPSLALCVFGVFILVYFSLWKGVRSSGKVVWVTALAPYVVLLILLARGVTLPGADEGIRYYLTPEWHKLQNSKVIQSECMRFLENIDFVIKTYRYGLMLHHRFSFRWDLDLVPCWLCPVTTNSITIVTEMLC